MKILLDLRYSDNNYHWQNEEELKNYINEMKKTLWEYYKNENLYHIKAEDITLNRLYNILDMFEKFEIINPLKEKESGKSEK